MSEAEAERPINAKARDITALILAYALGGPPVGGAALAAVALVAGLVRGERVSGGLMILVIYSYFVGWAPALFTGAVAAFWRYRDRAIPYLAIVAVGAGSTIVYAVLSEGQRSSLPIGGYLLFGAIGAVGALGVRYLSASIHGPQGTEA